MGPLQRRKTPGKTECATLRHTTLLAVLVAIILLEPFTRQELISVSFLVAMVVVALLLDGRRRRTRVAVLVMAFPAALQLVGTFWLADSSWWSTFTRGPFPVLLQLLLIASLFYCGYLILRSLLEARTVTANEIFGTLSLYLVIGLIWALVYGMLELAVPGSFGPASSVSGDAQGIPLVYFSFVTQASLGYGDITPQLPLASRLVILQTVMGQFYVAVVVAYLIAVFISQRKS